MSRSSGLLALACGTFALGMAEFSMMGILSPLAHNLESSIPQAGISYRLMPLARALGRLRRYFADRFHAVLVSGFTARVIVPTLLLMYFFSAFTPLSIALTFIGAAALFGLGGPLQCLIVRFARGGEILGGRGHSNRF